MQHRSIRQLAVLQSELLSSPTDSGPSADCTPKSSMSRRLIALKAQVFCHGLRIEPDIWSELCDEQHYKHKRAGLSQGRFFRLLDGEFSTAVNAPVLEPFVARSPLTLKRHGERYQIHRGGDVLCEAVPFQWPRWYARTLPDGTPMSRVVSAHCDTSLYTAIYQGGCDYWQADQMCAFCAMKVDQKAQWRSIDLVIEVAKAALAENPASEITFGGGTRLTADKSAKHKAKAILAFRKQVSMPVCVEMAAPDSDDWLMQLKDAGLDSILLNLELWNETQRRSLMPGKAAISRERYLDALSYSVKLFGVNQVSSQIIVGLEPINDTLEAIRRVADTGAIPLPVVFRPLPGTRLEDVSPPPVDDVIRVFETTDEWMKERALTGQQAKSGCALCGACSAHR